ncbi:Metal transporter CNNM2 [Platysternon megacephalum]|uniref:Metal transporter CNNM2 n=1 Tax=Platysternon megacephalum TaxID=55544 RepID=A0A4D9DNA3_9SAUR|nr:Metal transporter CNNM2 [Platysternon megacephalum]
MAFSQALLAVQRQPEGGSLGKYPCGGWGRDRLRSIQPDGVSARSLHQFWHFHRLQPQTLCPPKARNRKHDGLGSSLTSWAPKQGAEARARDPGGQQSQRDQLLHGPAAEWDWKPSNAYRWGPWLGIWTESANKRLRPRLS